MNFIKYLDNDQLNPPWTTEREVFTNNAPTDASLSFDQLVQKFPRVFSDSVGKVAGEYHMKL